MILLFLWWCKNDSILKKKSYDSISKTSRLDLKNFHKKHFHEWSGLPDFQEIMELSGNLCNPDVDVSLWKKTNKKLIIMRSNSRVANGNRAVRAARISPKGLKIFTRLKTVKMKSPMEYQQTRSCHNFILRYSQETILKPIKSPWTLQW